MLYHGMEGMHGKCAHVNAALWGISRAYARFIDEIGMRVYRKERRGGTYEWKWELEGADTCR